MEYIAVLGYGVVGKGVVGIIDANSTKEIQEIQVKKILVRNKEQCVTNRYTCNIDEIVNDEDISIVVECMGGIDDAYAYVSKCLVKGKHVVTSNKKMLANCAASLYEMACKHNCMLKAEASVGGGIAWFSNLERIQRIDTVTSFEGILNGTTNYILTHLMQNDTDFNTCLEKAQEKGYAEKDPSDDIDGLDVRYKVMLSMGKAFGVLVDPRDIPCFGIRNITRDAVSFAKTNNLTIKLIGKAINQDSSIQAYVIPTFLRNDHLFSNVDLNLNMVMCNSTTLGTSAYYGQGAGSFPTAHAVIQDVLDITKQRSASFPTHILSIDNHTVKSTYYVHTTTPIASSLIQTKLSKFSCITKEIPLSKIEDIVKNDANAFVAEVRK